MRAAVLLIATLALGSAAHAQTEECIFEKPPARPGHFGNLSLQSYGNRWEMQIATPSGVPTLDGKLQIDGTPWAAAEIDGGLDDSVVTISDIPGTLDLTEDLLEKMQGGQRVIVSGTANGEKVSASYSMSGSRKAIDAIRSGCSG